MTDTSSLTSIFRVGCYLKRNIYKELEMIKKNNKVISILLVLALIISVLQPIGTIKVKAAFTTTLDSTGTFHYVVLSDGAMITKLSDAANEMEEIVVPETVDGHKVYRLGGFYGDGSMFRVGTNKVKKIHIPNTVTYISQYGLFGYLGETLELPDSVTTLEQSAFSNLLNLKEMTLPESITKVPDDAFSTCFKLKKIVFKGNITYIGNNAFTNCRELTDINIPDKVSAIGRMAFYGCSKIERLDIPYSVKSIGEKAFSNMASLKILKVKDKLLNDTNENELVLGKNLLTSSSEVIEIDTNTKEVSVGDESFKSCTKLEKLHMNLAGTIGESAFEGLKNIADVQVDMSNVTELLNKSFYNTNGILPKVLNLNGDIKSIINPFEGNTEVASITIDGNGYLGSLGIQIKYMPNLEELNIYNYKGYILGCINNPKLKSAYLDVSKINTDGLKNNDVLKEIFISNNITSIATNALATSGVTVVTEVYSDNTAAINYDWNGSHRNVTVKSVSDYDKVPNVIQTSKTYRKANPSNVSFIVNLGRGSKAATDISSVMIDYTELEESNYELSGNILTIKKEVLKDLDKGVYDVGIAFNDTDGTSITGLLSIFVVESGSENNGDNDKPPVALETLSYQFYKDYQRDIMIPIQMNSAKTLEGLYLGTDLIDEGKYSFKNDTIVLDKDYLSTIEAGVYRIIPTFDGGMKINNLMLEVYNKYDDRLLPYLVPSHVDFKNQDLRLKVELGEGKTKATSVKLLVIDDMYILPNGEVYDRNPLESIEIVSSSAITVEDTKISQSFGEGYKLENKMLLGEKLYFYLDGSDLVLTAELIKKLDLVEGSIYSIGCVFNNSEETASLDRVKLVIPSKDNSESGDNDSSGGNNSDSGSSDDNSGSGDNNSGNNGSAGDNSNNGNNSSNNNGTSNGDNNSSNSGNNSGNNNSGSSNSGNGESSNGSSNNNNSNTENGSLDGKNSNIENPLDKDNNKESNTENNQDKNSVVKEIVALKDIIYNGKKDIIIRLPKKDKVIKVKLNGKSLKKSDYQVKGNKIVLLLNTLNQLKDGTNGVSVLTKSGVSYIIYIEYDFSKQESKIPFMTTYKLLLKGSKFPVYLSNQEELKEVKWTSSNSKIVSVNKKGILVAKKQGKATVTCVATNKNGDLYKFQIKVTVKDGNKKSFYTKIKDKSYSSAFPVFIMDKLVYKGKTVHIKVSNLAKDSKISYKSSNPSIATIDSKGNVRGKKKGTTIITVTLKQNNETYIYKLQCKCK